MKKLIIAVPEGESNLSSITGAYLVFRRANAYWRNQGHEDLFDIRLAGLSREVPLDGDLFAVRPHVDIARVEKADLIIVPAVAPPFHAAVERNGKLVAWLGDLHAGGAAIASLCSGAFLLASTGLLDGKRCSTHWEAAEEFRRMFPEVNLSRGEIITDEGSLYTNGGAFSFLNLLLYLVEKYYDRETAVLCAKVFQIDIDRECQSPYAIFSAQKSHDDDLVREAQRFLENNFAEKISIDKLAGRMAAGRRNFDRRFIKATGDTPAGYLQRVRVEAAKRCLETENATVSEVMYRIGYSDAKNFRETFRKITGLSPAEYRNKYNKERAFSWIKRAAAGYGA